MLLDFLPSTFGGSTTTRGSDFDFVSEIEADFGLAPSSRDPFRELEASLTGGIFRDPFELSLDPSFGVTNDHSNGAIFEQWYDHLADDVDMSTGRSPDRKARRNNAYRYKHGNVFEANWYKKFLCAEVRDRTYFLSSRDRFGEFRCLFRVPLSKVDELVSIFLENDWVPKSRWPETDEEIKAKAELLIMSVLNVLGHNNPFRVLRSNTEIGLKRHHAFFHHFLLKMYSLRDDYIYLPRTPEDLAKVTATYAAKHLPGCCGSVDVVHMKWSMCPAGDYNRCKGKEGYPTLAFEAISDHHRRIMGISSVQFGTRNDKHIVKLDKAVKHVRDGWYNTITWNFYDSEGQLKTAIGVYLICDGGYLRWPILVCPYQGANVATLESHFSANLESIRKDVECIFGILKKRWKMLECGVRFRNIRVVEKVFVVCCILHNLMLSEMETHESNERVGRGAPAGSDAIWLQGPLPPARITAGARRISAAKRLAADWYKRRKELAEHLE